ncbi:NUDIX domain-containing protein [Glycomyces buryatensis]|uniref:NUDIX domain-containing protein n=1 Tax=Glycomyces buryatensis TaxID=2570927 RepID=A0A4S8PTG8_9ACTN|nr:NUDIX domain-containing protein [Glycomyces buryatensis]THV34697.1 NUDIX domain-containing protein [Glycomyces buryatensis]
MSLDRSELEEQLWRQGATGALEVHRLTSGRPFCAGVLLVRDGKLLTTLSADGISAHEATGTDWSIGGVGGGQEPGEDLWECARREGIEELGMPLQLTASTRTYLHEGDSDELHQTRSADQPAPFAVQRRRNIDPTRPFRPGLPAGPYTYCGMFLAELVDDELAFKPDDPDIAALIWMPLNAWDTLDDGSTFADLTAMGAQVAAGGPIADDARIHLSEAETLRVVAPLLVDKLDDTP